MVSQLFQVSLLTISYDTLRGLTCLSPTHFIYTTLSLFSTVQTHWPLPAHKTCHAHFPLWATACALPTTSKSHPRVFIWLPSSCHLDFRSNIPPSEITSLTTPITIYLIIYFTLLITLSGISKTFREPLMYLPLLSPLPLKYKSQRAVTMSRSPVGSQGVQQCLHTLDTPQMNGSQFRLAIWIICEDL